MTRPAIALLALLLLATVAEAQWISASDAAALRAERSVQTYYVQQCYPGSGSCCPTQPRYSQPQRQPQQPNVPIVGSPGTPKFTPRAEAAPPSDKTEPEKPAERDWAAWEKAIQERIDKIDDATKETHATLVAIHTSLAAQKPCGCGPQWTSLEARLTAIEAKLNQPPPVVEPPAVETHVVVVVDHNAPYWPRLAGAIEKTKETYHGVQTAPLPDFPIGEHPQAVIYESNVPVRVAKGQYAVEALLSRLSRGEPI